MSAKMRRGLTLIELMIVIVLFVVLAAATVYIFRVVLLSWSGQETRAGVDINIDRAVEEVVRDLRETRQVQSTAGYDEVRFTQDGTNFYIYYLYNADDSYGPPPAFDQGSYELRKAALTGGIGGVFTYGEGTIIISDILPPPSSDLSYDGSLITVDLTVRRYNEEVRSKTEIKPRNL